MSKFKNKYTVESTRLKNYDYTQNGFYFITICTYKHEIYFGEIINKTMHLNDIGMVAKQSWINIPQHFPFVKLNQFIVMPDHVHGIIQINKPVLFDPIGLNVRIGFGGSIGLGDPIGLNDRIVETNDHSSLHIKNIKIHIKNIKHTIIF